MSQYIYVLLPITALLIAGLLFKCKKQKDYYQLPDDSYCIKDINSYAKKLELIINSMSDGLIAVDKSLNTTVINPFAREILGLGSESIRCQSIHQLIKDESVCSLIEKSIREDCSFSEEITLEKQRKILKVTINPIKSNLEVLGAMLVIEDITEIKILQQIGSEFISNVSHELKTPLTSIRGFIETLKNGAINDPQYAYKFLDIIDIEAERLFLLINDILALSEIETMQQDTDVASVSIEKVIADSINILEGQAEKKHISINIDLEPKLKIQANKFRLMQLVLNLVDNSMKYSPEGSWIMIKAHKTEENVVISFKDSGIGIPKEHFTRIFERFYRVNKGRSRSLGGTGLGLSIVKHIVELYNGTIDVSSEPGKGTEFIVKLPQM